MLNVFLGRRSLSSIRLVDPKEIQKKIEKLPYFLERTKVGKNLPIYTDYRYNGQKVATIIRRIYGDINALATHLRDCLPAKAALTIRPDLGHIKIKGNYHSRLKGHFTKMGF